MYGRRCKKVTRSGGEEEGPLRPLLPVATGRSFLLFAGIGKEEYLDTLKQRAEVFRNINSKPITYAPHKTALRGILTKLEVSARADPEDLEDAGTRMCAPLETRKTANGIWTEAGKRLKSTTAASASSI